MQNLCKILQRVRPLAVLILFLFSGKSLGDRQPVKPALVLKMKVAVEGCCHGELDKIYETLQYLEQVNNIKVDLLLICGDFQAVRNRDDFKAMAVPQKYQKLNTFYK